MKGTNPLRRFMVSLVVAALWVVPGWAASPPGSVEPAFDAAPFGMVIHEGDRDYGVKWGEPRKIRRVVVEFGDGPLPSPETVRVQYWQGIWKGGPDPILAEQGAGGVGWAAVDDWTNGKWKDADARVRVDGRRMEFTFAPTGEKEFKDLGGPGVGYRRTLKLRVVTGNHRLEAGATEVYRRDAGATRLAAYTDAELRPVTARILFGKPANPAIQAGAEESPKVEVCNGAVLGTRKIDGGLAADLLMAVDPLDARYDRTVVTVRSEKRPFSFAADEVARGERILIDDLGVLVTRGGDEITLEGYRQARREFPGRRIYERVSNEDEQTLPRAWSDMPLKRPLYFVHGLPGDRNAMHQQPNGDIAITAKRHWFSRPKSARDTDRKLWPGEFLTLRFGFPADRLRGGRELKDGYLPVLRTWWQDGPVYYEETTVMVPLDGAWDKIVQDTPTLLHMRVRVVNTSADKEAAGVLRITSQDGEEKLTFSDGFVLAREGDNARLRCVMESTRGSIREEGTALRGEVKLGPGESHEVYVKIPSITLTKTEETEALRERTFAADSEAACAFWRERTAAGTLIDTPEPWLNDFYKSHLRHLLVNCVNELGSDRLHAHVGTLGYGVYPDESAMMISDLDRRGYHKEAQRCLDSFLQYQGTVQMPGNFKTTDGLFYGSGGHETGGYNKSHGWAMWLMAEHWKYTRDREWMERAAPKLIKAIDWVTRERQATMKTNPDGSRPIEYGWLPSGSLEDVTDYWYWMVTNICTVWGCDALSAALADYGHPEAPRLLRDAKAYHDDVMRAVQESRVRAPVVKLRDGTYVPKFPSELYARGRTYGWLRETLEGAIHLLITEMIPPDAPEARWIIDDYEDNLYISKDYGYDIPNFDAFWFSRGGFSMQANLLGGPLVYLYRDDVKHFLRAYFNSFASAFYPEIRMCNEHSMPELGYPAGDHFKTSDEAQSTYWLRLMFVNERGQNLYLGQAIPRYWLEDGKHVSIERAASHFGPLSFKIESSTAKGEIKATVTPPERNRPQTIYVRLRHPEGKPMKSVTVNGQAWERFDPKKEWVVLPGNVRGTQDIVAKY